MQPSIPPLTLPLPTGVSVAASVFTLVALSLERYVVIRHPVFSRRLRTASWVRATVLLIWLFSAVLMLPIALVRGVVQHPLSTPDRPLPICYEQWRSARHRQALDVSLFVLIYVLPGCALVTLHSASGCHLLSGGAPELRLPGSAGARGRKLVAGRRRAARLLLCLAGLFALSWMPYYAMTLYTDFQPDETLLGAVSLALLLAHSNSAQNPILYCLLNANFRQGVWAMLTCQSRRGRHATLSRSPTVSVKTTSCAPYISNDISEIDLSP